MAGRVTREDLPQASLLHGLRRPGDFTDCYACDSPLSAMNAAQVLVDFPGWTVLLLRLRNRLVRPLGLKSGARGEGPMIGPFPLQRQTADEVVAGFDDKHLDFRVSVLRAGGRIYASTWVRTHNLGGRAYLAAVMPFHIAIMRGGAQRVARAASTLAVRPRSD